MPELPEVQTIINDLNEKIIGSEILDFHTDFNNSIKLPLSKFKKSIIGHKILKIQRKGKYLLFYLTGKNVMIVHLRMTGHLLIYNNIKADLGDNKYFFPVELKYVRHFWSLQKNRKNIMLIFSDIRKFATIDLIKEQNIDKAKMFINLGIDPLSEKFTMEKFKKISLERANSTVRNVLLNQNTISGIGNIYASEILFLAKINPKKLFRELSTKEIKKIHTSIIKILKKAIANRGTSISDYRDAEGNTGNFQNLLDVYGRKGEQCHSKKCNEKIIREKINQRSAFWCPGCQK